MKRLLIITYYWPPSGGSPVLRWLKFSKYLRNFGWEPIIYTPSNPEPQDIDESLLSEIPDDLEVIKTRIIEPYGLYKTLTGREKKERLGVGLMSDKKEGKLIKHISLWIRSNLFVPDPRVFWIKPSVTNIIKYLYKSPVEAIITTGPPHSMHLIGLQLKKATGITWVADFRDPWTNIDFYKQLTLSHWADKKHKSLEKKVLSSADCIITVSPTMSKEFKLMGAEKVETITNGFDNESFERSEQPDGMFSITHLGSIPLSRNSESLWQAISEAIVENDGMADLLEINLIGKVDISVIECINKFNLNKYINYKSYIPHLEALKTLINSQVLLLLINSSPNAGGILTNKFFEYLQAGRPVLAIGPTDGDLAEILKETTAGFIYDFIDTGGIKKQLQDFFNLYKNGKLKINSTGIEKYSRKELTSKLAELLNKLVP